MMPAPGASPDAIEAMALFAEDGPLAEAMFLMMSADGQVTQEERDVLRGALRNLSGDELRTAHIEKMLDDAAERLEAEGRDKRLEQVVSELRGDADRAEVTFVLAAAIAFADGTIADEENDTIGSLAEGLGIDEAKANALMDTVDADLKSTGG